METLADLFASSAAPNVAQLPQQSVAFQKPGGLRKTVGMVADVLAAMGGRQMGYQTGIANQEKAYNESIDKQRLQNVFRDFVQNPNDQAVAANLAFESPDTFMKVAPQNKILPAGGIARVGMLGTPEMVVDAPTKPVNAKEAAAARLLSGDYTPAQKPLLEQLAGAGPSGSEFQVIEGANGFVRVNKITGEATPLGVAGKPRAASGGSGGGKGGGQVTPNQAAKAAAQDAAKRQATVLVSKLAGLYRQLEGMGAAPGSAGSIAGNLRARAMTTGLGQLVGQGRGSDAQAIIDEIEKTKSLLLPLYAGAMGLGSKQFDTPAEKESILQAFGSVGSRTDANINALSTVAEMFGGSIPDAPKRSQNRPAAGNITVPIGGKTYTFPNQKAADEFKAQAARAGIR